MDTDITTIDWADHEKIAADINVPFENWSHQCHAISIAIVKRYRLGRVARGACRGVGVHSWITLGDPYDPGATVIDPTLWSYDDTVTGIWTGTLADGRHLPDGWYEGKHILDWGCPRVGGDPEVVLTPATPLSRPAEFFLDMCRRQAGGGLDRLFWSNLVNNAPVAGWPAAELIAAVADTEAISVVVPMDRLGMLTDRNPGGVYLPGD